MFKVFYNKRAQNFLEYAMLIMVLAAAILAMRQYMQRSINAKMKQIQEELNESKR